jgi:isoquinoline 1-oxidoreductase beta subunit
MVFGLSAALYNSITFKGGQVEQSNFHNYRQMRINEVPPFEVHIIPSSENPGGIGESGTVSAAPALGNAIFAATGIRLRRLPFAREQLQAPDIPKQTLGMVPPLAMGLAIASSTHGRSEDDRPDVASQPARA